MFCHILAGHVLRSWLSYRVACFSWVSWLRFWFLVMKNKTKQKTSSIFTISLTACNFLFLLPNERIYFSLLKNVNFGVHKASVLTGLIVSSWTFWSFWGAGVGVLCSLVHRSVCLKTSARKKGLPRSSVCEAGCQTGGTLIPRMCGTWMLYSDALSISLDISREML